MPKSNSPITIWALEGSEPLRVSQHRETLSEDDQLIAKLYAAREDERRRVARELHDDLAQRFAVLNLQLAEVIHSIPPELPALSTLMTSLHHQAVEFARDLRRVAMEQHPSIAGSRGVQNVLRDLVRDYRRRRGVPIRFRASGVSLRIPDEKANHIYRIAQEALRNALKHAGGAPVEIKVISSASSIRLEIRDFGIGFDPTAQHNRSLGLLNMEERARLLNANLSLSSRKGHGTRISLEVPLSVAEEEK